MKKLLFLLFILFPALALAQAPTKICIESADGRNCTAVSQTNPLPIDITSSAGVGTQISLDGALSVQTQAYPQFADTFSSALDTVTNWTAKNSTGTAVVSSGQLVINSSTTASAWGGLTSQQSFAPVGVNGQVWGVLASFSVTTQANSVRVFGIFTVPATPTTAIPVTDGYIYRLDGTGALFAEIWSSGVAVSSVNVTTSCLPTAGVPGIFAINYRASLVQFSCGSSTVVNLAPVVGINPVNQILPVSALSIAGSTPPSASAVINLSAIALATVSSSTIKSSNQAPTINDPSTVVSISPNVVGLSPITTSALAANLIVKATGGNLSSFEVSADSTLSTAAWWIMVYDATIAPADGTVTPAKCYAMTSGATSFSAAFLTPIQFVNGIVIGVSTTGCFNKTASTHAFISGDAR